MSRDMRMHQEAHRHDVVASYLCQVQKNAKGQNPMSGGRYTVTLSHYGREISQEGFTAFQEALGRAKALRALYESGKGYFVRLSGDSAEAEIVDGRWIAHDGLTLEERDQWT